MQPRHLPPLNGARVVIPAVHLPPSRRHHVAVERRLADALVDSVVKAAHPHLEVVSATYNRRVVPGAP
jgi:hypothetical protein